MIRAFNGYTESCRVAHYYSKMPFEYENICFRAYNNFHINCKCHENLFIVTT